MGGCGRSGEWDSGIDIPTDTTAGTGADDGDGSNDDGDSESDGTVSEGGSDDQGDDDDPEVESADILFIVDNSGSMGLEQANLVVKMPRLFSVLEREDYDYRIGFTTTDTGNPLCSNTEPEFGHLQMISCRDHLNDFVFPADSNVDLRDMCTDRCSLSGLETLDGKPWIDVDRKGGNLPPDVGLAEAVRCVGLQGISGCGLESPLAAMEYTRMRSTTDGEREWGFFRAGSIAVIVFVTDEADCSHNPAFESIFLPSGDRTFWSNPEASSANSAVCWNAGVLCDGGPGVYEDCWAANKDVLGAVGVDSESAVLFPVDWFVSVLEELREEGEGLLVAGLVGVPIGYENGSVDLIYADAEDPAFQDAFGIGPGCTSPLTTAVPPVRLREVVESVSGRSTLYSVCSDDYGPALEALGETIVALRADD